MDKREVEVDRAGTIKCGASQSSCTSFRDVSDMRVCRPVSVRDHEVRKIAIPARMKANSLFDGCFS